MSNFREDILEAAKGEPIVGIVVSDPDVWGDGGEPFEREFTSWSQLAGLANRVLDWDEVAPLLDQEYDDGYGGQDCPSVLAWTPTRVLFVGEYDGATWITYVPRHPTDVNAHAVGGG